MIKKNAAAQNAPAVESVKVTRLKQFDDGSVVFDAVINGVSCYGMRWIEREGAKSFAAFPQRKGKDGKYYNIVYIRLSDENNADIEKQLEGLL